jgi:hypothetical protein
MKLVTYDLGKAPRAGLAVGQKIVDLEAGDRELGRGKLPASVDKKMWIEMLRAAGIDEKGMLRWHSEFERRAPDGHQEFLLSLGIPEDEVERIRRFSRGEVKAKD